MGLQKSSMVFLVVAFVKKRARLLQSLVFFSSFSSRQTQSDEIFVQFVQLNEYLGNASKLSQRVPTFSFHFFKRNIQNRTILKGPGCYEFGLLLNFFDIARLLFRTFFVSKGLPFDFIEVSPRNIRSKALYPNF